jgi:hypothetical protein
MPPLAPEHLERLTLIAPDVARTAGYRLVVLFGSAARGALRPEDLDLGILADGLVDTVAAANRFLEAWTCVPPTRFWRPSSPWTPRCSTSRTRSSRRVSSPSRPVGTRIRSTSASWSIRH